MPHSHADRVRARENPRQGCDSVHMPREQPCERTLLRRYAPENGRLGCSEEQAMRDRRQVASRSRLSDNHAHSPSPPHHVSPLTQGVQKPLHISEDGTPLPQAATSAQSDRAASPLPLWVRRRQCAFDQLSLEQQGHRRCTRALPNPNACEYRTLRFSCSLRTPPKPLPESPLF